MILASRSLLEIPLREDPLTVAWVPTGMKTGVSIVAMRGVQEPARAPVSGQPPESRIGGTFFYIVGTPE